MIQRIRSKDLVGRITASKMDYCANFQQRRFLATFTMDIVPLLDAVYETSTFFQITGSGDVVFMNN